MNVCLLIPAYNEARTIGQVVSKARKIIASVVVVDDGSWDATAQIAQDSGALVLKHQVNSGKGAALRTGFQYALDHSYDAVITMDSDGQHDVGDIPAFLEAFKGKFPPLKKTNPPLPPFAKGGKASSPFSKGEKASSPFSKGEKASSPFSKGEKASPPFSKGGKGGFEGRAGPGIIIGSRMQDISTMPAVRKVTNKLTSFIGSLLAHQELKDSQSGFRLISSDVLRAVELETSGYEMESELLIKASRSGFRITSVPIKTIYGQEVSKINPMVDTYRFIRLLFRSLRW